GGELISPMLLSHRRLMIGDHKQLPPFGSEQIIRILEQPEVVRQALLVGEEFIGRSLRDAATEELIDQVEEQEATENDAFPALCAEAIRVLMLFESMIEQELARQRRSNTGRPIAKKLTAQHRMHPAIARLVSRCFYEGDLESDVRSAARYEAEPCPF